jgi:hypothetical protein
MPEWSKGGDLRSSDASLAGSNPALSSLKKLHHVFADDTHSCTWCSFTHVFGTLFRLLYRRSLFRVCRVSPLLDTCTFHLHESRSRLECIQSTFVQGLNRLSSYRVSVSAHEGDGVPGRGVHHKHGRSHRNRHKSFDTSSFDSEIVFDSSDGGSFVPYFEFGTPRVLRNISHCVHSTRVRRPFITRENVRVPTPDFHKHFQLWHLYAHVQ